MRPAHRRSYGGLHVLRRLDTKHCYTGAHKRTCPRLKRSSSLCRSPDLIPNASRQESVTRSTDITTNTRQSAKSMIKTDTRSPKYI